MDEFDDRFSIHTTTPLPKSRSHARVYNNTYHILKTNTSTPRTSSSSIMSYMDPSTTYTTPRTSHRTPKLRQRGNIDPLRYKVE